MATKTFEELKQLAIQIRDEKTNKQNTATRIGTQMLEHLDKLEQDYYDKTATDEELKERDEKLTELEGQLGSLEEKVEGIGEVDLSGLENKTSSIGYVTCDTAAGTAAKVLTVAGLTTLSTGIRLLVKMTNNNTASNVTLNINNLGAKPLYYNNIRVSGKNAWEAGEVIDIYYDGTNFYSNNVESKNGGIGYVICDTAAGTVDKSVTVTGLTALSTGIRLLIKMTNNNTASNVTMNINNLGSKPLFYNNTRVSGDNAWESDEVIDVYYDGTNFYSSNVQGGGEGGNLILEWKTDAATTRKQVKQSDRKSMLQISYKDSNGNPIYEQYIGTTYTDTEWAKDSNWEKIATKKDLNSTKEEVNQSLDSTKEEINQTLEEFSKDFSPTDLEKDEIFEIGYPGSYWIEDGLISATDFSIYPDCYTGEINDLSGKNNKLTVSGLSSIDYSQAIAGIRGGELIKNYYNSVKSGAVGIKFTPPIDANVNLLTIETYANLHTGYWWNKKEIEIVNDLALAQAMFIFTNGYYRFAISTSAVKCYGSLGMDNLEVAHDNSSFIDGALDKEIKNKYAHLVYVINNIDKTVKFYIDSEKVLELNDRGRLESVIKEYDLFHNWYANIKCIRIYNKELSQEEITQNYEATKSHYAV